jgi:hypothetical protein
LLLLDKESAGAVLDFFFVFSLGLLWTFEPRLGLLFDNKEFTVEAFMGAGEDFLFGTGNAMCLVCCRAVAFSTLLLSQHHCAV